MAQYESVRSYRDLKVWQRGVDLVETIYRLSDAFPDAERYCLTTQVRRAALSISSNIAEGWGRGTRKDYRHFLRIARASLFEVETQLIIAHRLGYLQEETLRSVLRETDAESRMLLSLMRSLHA